MDKEHWEGHIAHESLYTFLEKGVETDYEGGHNILASRGAM